MKDCELLRSARFKTVAYAWDTAINSGYKCCFAVFSVVVTRCELS